MTPPPVPPNKRTILGYGAIPQPIDNDKDTEPNLFGKGAESIAAPGDEEATAPRCYLCGRSAFDRDDGFESGIDYALTQVQGMLQWGNGSHRLEPEAAAKLVAWMRQKIQPNKPR